MTIDPREDYSLWTDKGFTISPNIEPVAEEKEPVAEASVVSRVKNYCVENRGTLFYGAAFVGGALYTAHFISKNSEMLDGILNDCHAKYSIDNNESVILGMHIVHKVMSMVQTATCNQWALTLKLFHIS